MKKRINVLLEEKTITTLDAWKKEGKKKNKNVSRSSLIDQLVERSEDPIKRKKDETKELAQKINRLQDEVKHLEEK